MRDLGPATRLDNTRPGSLSGRASRASQPMGTRPAERGPKANFPGRHPQGYIPRGGIAERFRFDVLEKSGRWRWPMGQRSARRRPLGRQPWWRRWAGPARPRSAASRFRGAVAARTGPLSARVAGRLWNWHRHRHRRARYPRRSGWRAGSIAFCPMRSGSFCGLAPTIGRHSQVSTITSRPRSRRS